MSQIKIDVVGQVPHKNEYYIYLENGQKIRIAKGEYQKIKRKLDGKSDHYLEMEDKEKGSNK